MTHGSVARQQNDPPEPERPPTRLVLASEALRDDVAPYEPGRSGARWSLGAVGVALGLLGLALRIGAPQATTNEASVTFAAAGAALALGVLPFSYMVRAGATCALGLVLMALGLDGAGPLGGVLGGPSGTGVARLVALAVLPGALLFRARYRAYGRARAVLAAALVATAPFVILRVLFAFDPALPMVERAGAALAVAAVLSGLSGFMGEDTTAGGSVWAAILVAALATDLGLGGLRASPHALVGHLAAALGTALAGALVATGSFHLLAGGLAADARRIARKRDQTAD